MEASVSLGMQETQMRLGCGLRVSMDNILTLKPSSCQTLCEYENTPSKTGFFFFN